MVSMAGNRRWTASPMMSPQAGQSSCLRTIHPIRPACLAACRLGNTPAGYSRNSADLQKPTAPIRTGAPVLRIGKGMAMATPSTSIELIKLSDSDQVVGDPAEDIRGRTVRDRDGHELGRVADLLIDPEERKVRFL